MATWSVTLPSLRIEDSKVKYSIPHSIAWPGHAAWLDWPWKLHRIQDQEGDIRWELYQLEKDPLETNDLASGEPAKAGEMRSGLEAWQKSVIRSLYGLDYE